MPSIVYIFGPYENLKSGMHFARLVFPHETEHLAMFRTEDIKVRDEILREHSIDHTVICIRGKLSINHVDWKALFKDYLVRYAKRNTFLQA